MLYQSAFTRLSWKVDLELSIPQNFKISIIISDFFFLFLAYERSRVAWNCDTKEINLSQKHFWWDIV